MVHAASRDRGLQCSCAVDSEIDRPWRLGFDSVVEPTEGAVGREHGADAGGERAEGGVSTNPCLHHHLELGAMLVVVSERRERDSRPAGVAVAHDQQTAGRHTIGQDPAAQDRPGLGLQEGVHSR